MAGAPSRFRPPASPRRTTREEPHRPPPSPARATDAAATDNEDEGARQAAACTHEAPARARRAAACERCGARQARRQARRRRPPPDRDGAPARGGDRERGAHPPLLAHRAADQDRGPPRRARRPWRAGDHRARGAAPARIWARILGEIAAAHGPARRGVPRRADCRITVATIDLEPFSGASPARGAARARVLRRDVPRRTLERAGAPPADRRHALRADRALRATRTSSPAACPRSVTPCRPRRR